MFKFFAALTLLSITLAHPAEYGPKAYITTVVTYCPVKTPKRPLKACEDHEIAQPNVETTSVMACAMGGMMNKATFLFEGELWHTKGVRCREHWVQDNLGDHLVHKFDNQPAR